MKSNDNLKKIGTIIITCAISALVQGVLAKIGEWLGVWGQKLGETSLRHYLNYVCKTAAQANHDMLTMILTIFLMGTLCGGILMLMQLVRREAKSESKTASNDSADMLDEKPEKEDSNDNSNKRTHKMQRNAKIMTTVLAVLVLILVVCWFTSYALPIQLLNQFEMDIKAITPYVDETEIQKLESQWVLMKGCYDYNEIQEFIRTVKETYNLAS